MVDFCQTAGVFDLSVSRRRWRVAEVLFAFSGIVPDAVFDSVGGDAYLTFGFVAAGMEVVALVVYCVGVQV